MKVIIVLIFLCLAGAFVLDSMRKRKSKPKDPSQRLMSANEAPPTETGRLRVKHIVDAIKKPAPAHAEGGHAESVAPDGESKTSLPDPFENK